MSNSLCQLLACQLSAPPAGYLEGYKALYACTSSAVVNEMKQQNHHLLKKIYITLYFVFVGN